MVGHHHKSAGRALGFAHRSDHLPSLGPSLVDQSSDDVDAGTATVALLKSDTMGDDELGDGLAGGHHAVVDQAALPVHA